VRALPPRYRRVLVDHGLLLPSPVASRTANARHALQMSDPQCLLRATPDAVVAAQIASAAHLNIHTPLQVRERWCIFRVAGMVLWSKCDYFHILHL
jgi:hypothetical protein